MDKTLIAATLLNIKTLQDALDAEMKNLRQHLSVGDSIECDGGKVTMHTQERSTYDGAGLLKDLVAANIDPNIIGEVVVSVDRVKLASAIGGGMVDKNLVDSHTTTSVVESLRITPNKNAKEAGVERVASLLKK